MLLLLAIVALFTGLIRPVIFNRIFKRELTRKNVLVYFGGATIAFFIMFAIFSEPSPTPAVEQRNDQVTAEQQEEAQEVENEVVEEEEQEEVAPQTETATEVEAPTTQTPPQQQQQIQPEPEPETQQQSEPEPVSDGKKWYVSSHWSSEYYYCEESDGWKSLSESYLRVYDSEAALLADYPNHTLHESCQ